MTAPSVGLVEIGLYIPEGWMSSEELARRSGIPQEIIETKFGLKGKHLAAPSEHVSDMAVKAARPLLRQVPPEEIDAVIYYGSPHKDYYVWIAAAKIQHELGAHRAFAFEISNVSAGLPVALKVAKDMLVADQDLNCILLAGASTESRLIDYMNPRSRFMVNFGDGAAAALIKKGHPENRILASAFLTDGSFHSDVYVPAGGSVTPPSRETVERGLHTFDVVDPERMKQRLDPVSLRNFVRVIEEAVRKSDGRLEEIGFLACLHTKRSLFEQLLEALGLEKDRAIFLDEFGHMSAIDPLVALELGRREQRLRPGQLVVLASAGTGYTWGATVLRWGNDGWNGPGG